ncbi:MAG: MmcQ/YjbR family DNA-binding protein [Clostridia bacterium]|nr:MmcQ/YjbR family DNA-binding protein [Clostridia bacterium]
MTPGYHMNKWHWNSVFLRSDVPETLLRALTLESYRLTAP